MNIYMLRETIEEADTKSEKILSNTPEEIKNEAYDRIDAIKSGNYDTMSMAKEIYDNSSNEMQETLDRISFFDVGSELNLHLKDAGFSGVARFFMCWAYLANKMMALVRFKGEISKREFFNDLDDFIENPISNTISHYLAFLGKGFLLGFIGAGIPTAIGGALGGPIGAVIGYGISASMLYLLGVMLNIMWLISGIKALFTDKKQWDENPNKIENYYRRNYRLSPFIEQVGDVLFIDDLSEVWY